MARCMAAGAATLMVAVVAFMASMVPFMVPMTTTARFHIVLVRCLDPHAFIQITMHLLLGMYLVFGRLGP